MTLFCNILRDILKNHEAMEDNNIDTDTDFIRLLLSNPAPDEV